jgi:CRP/FNR family transcriptional regulator, dissimilatory nitrate respiration regulator
MAATIAWRLGRLWTLSQTHAVDLALQCTALSARRAEVIVHRGVRLPGVLVLTAGMVKLCVHSADADERVLHIVRAGEAFGEPAALLGRPCLYDAVALTDVAALSVPATSLLTLAASDDRFARSLVLALAARAYTVLAEYEAATTQRSAQRLACYLESLLAAADPRGRHTIELPVSKSVVAALLGMKKETLSRLLRQFTAEGLIRMARREIVVVDIPRLAATARNR